MSLLSLLADAPDFSKTADLVVVLLNAILSPVSIIAGAICILYIIKHGLKIKKFADDPKQRNIQIYAVCWCVFGLALCIFAPIFINTILPELINSSGSYEPPIKQGFMELIFNLPFLGIIDWILTGIYKAVWGIFITGPLGLVSVFTQVLEFLSSGIIFSLLFNSVNCTMKCSTL